MSNTELENRISALEKEEKSKVPWWEERLGIFADDPIYDEAMRLGREYRLAQKEDYDKDEEGK